MQKLDSLKPRCSNPAKSGVPLVGPQAVFCQQPASCCWAVTQPEN